jgi:predicted AAA+ superfamily ATPase
MTTTEQTVYKEELLAAYVTLYLEQEVRAEALVRNLANFAKFLVLAASESGYIINYAKLSQQIGVARTTIVDYYQILEDCLIAECVEPITESTTRHKLSKSKKYLMFDLGVRRLAADEGEKLPEKSMGHLFEEFVGLELIRQSRVISSKIKLRYWRDNDGPEVDWILEYNGEYTAIEVKYTDMPTKHDAAHLETFMNEYKEAKAGFIICRVPRPRKITDQVTALPWQLLHEIVESLF